MRPSPDTLGANVSFRVRVNSVEDYGGTYLRVSAKIEEVDTTTGEVLHTTGAQIERNLNFEDGVVGNSMYMLPPHMQRKGIGTTLLAHWEDQQLDAGFHEAEVHASSSYGGMNGGYTWLRYGYEPDDPPGVCKPVLTTMTLP